MIRASSFIPAGQTEFVDGFLFENAPSNWALEINHQTGDGSIMGFFTSEPEMNQAISLVADEIGHLTSLKFSTCIIEDQDWQQSYKNHFFAWKYENVHFVPLWLKDSYRVPKNDISIMLDPGMAFGTGNHETTRMCLEFLIENNKSSLQPSESIVDLGCGSGILSIASSLLGFKKVYGVDNDEDAVRISKENALLNQVNNQILFKCASLLDLNERVGSFDCVVANIQADILITCSKKINELAHAKSKIILSGILSKEIDQVIEVFVNEQKDSSIFEYQLKEAGEWTAVQFTRSNNG